MAKAAAKTPRVTVLEGHDLLVLDDLIARAVKKQGGPDQCDVHRFDADREEILQAIETARAPSLLCPACVIAITNLQDAKVDEVEKLARYVAHPERDVIMILQIGPGKALRKAHKDLIKGLPKFDLNKERKKAVEQAIADIQKEFEIEFERKALDAIRDAYSQQAGSCREDLEKLALYAGKGGKVTAEVCRRLITVETEEIIWKIGNVVGARNAKEALRVLHSLLEQGEEPVVLLGTLQTLYRRFWLVKQAEAQKVPQKALADETGLKGYALKKTVEQAKAFSKEYVEKSLRLLAQADEELKGGSRWKELTLERLVVRLTDRGANS